MQTRSLFRSLKIPAHLTRAAGRCALVAALALLAVGGERVALVSEARAQAGGNDPQEDEGGVTNPADCIETELVWTEERDSDVNSLIRDYFFPYPEGIRVSNRCSNTVSVRLGADATLTGIVESVTDDAVHYTPDLTSEDVLECESLSSLSFANTTEFLAFPERVRATAEEYNYERALHLVNLPKWPDVWKDLRWRVSYTGCAEWVDARLRIGTGNKRCGVRHCPGRSAPASDNFFSGEVVQAGSSGQQAAGQEESRERTALERELAGEMVDIPGGTFRMGDLSGEGDGDELPVHSVTVPAFRLGKYEVTFAQWDACVADGGCNGYSPDDIRWGRGNRPVINVSWDDIQAYIDWLNGRTGGNYRLPTEAEWEYAARAGSTTKYSWGDDLGSNRANCKHTLCGDSHEFTAPVGSFPANAWGLHDMHGNVWEWVQDCWNDSYEGAPSDGSAWESGDCDYRGVRGGAWYSYADWLHSASRGGTTRARRDSEWGFRLAQDK